MLPCVLLAAAPGESRAICRGAVGSGAIAKVPPNTPPSRDREPIELVPGLWLVQTGVGKVSAAISAAWAVQNLRPASMLSIGVAGTLPSSGNGPTLPLHAIVLASSCVYADEGVRTPAGFTDIAQAGFAPSGLSGMSIRPSDDLNAHLRAFLSDDPIATARFTEGVVATVSTCSGTDALAEETARRTHAVAEAMEGAAIAHTLAICAPDVHFAEVRVISNTTGDRDRQVWDLPGAFDILAQIAGRFIR